MELSVQGLEVHDRSADELEVPLLHAVLKLRSDVFIVEQACAYPDIDGLDLLPSTRHVWLAPPEHPQEVACYLRILARPDGGHRIGRVVTAPDHRGRGLGRALIGLVLQDLTGVVTLEAQAHLERYYAALGFTVAGAPYVEDGIPHVPMRQTR